MKRSPGFSAVEGLIALTVVVLIGLVGYNLYSMNQARNQSANEQKAVANHEPAAPEINNDSDLDKAAEALDAVDVDQNQAELQELDSETAF